VLTGAVALGGCGGGARQDANEPSGTFKVDVVDASFPAKQRLSEPERLRIAVKNIGDRDVPDVAVTVDSFGEASQQQGLADPERPVWLVDAGPRGGTTAYVNTWALGRLRAGQTRTFTWRVTAVAPGEHKVHWTVAAGLNGKAKARLRGNRVPEGEFTVNVSPKPSQASVDPATGKVVRSSD
jgi:hypothetical protein